LHRHQINKSLIFMQAFSIFEDGVVQQAHLL